MVMLVMMAMSMSMSIIKSMIPQIRPRGNA